MQTAFSSQFPQWPSTNYHVGVGTHFRKDDFKMEIKGDFNREVVSFKRWLAVRIEMGWMLLAANVLEFRMFDCQFWDVRLKAGNGILPKAMEPLMHGPSTGQTAHLLHMAHKVLPPANLMRRFLLVLRLQSLQILVTSEERGGGAQCEDFKFRCINNRKIVLERVLGFMKRSDNAKDDAFGDNAGGEGGDTEMSSLMLCGLSVLPYQLFLMLQDGGKDWESVKIRKD